MNKLKILRRNMNILKIPPISGTLRSRLSREMRQCAGGEPPSLIYFFQVNLHFFSSSSEPPVLTLMTKTRIMDLNPVKDCGGREEKKRDEEILVDADSRHLKAPDDGNGNYYSDNDDDADSDDYL